MSSTSAPHSPPKNRTHYLYVAVIVAVALGILVGVVAPGFAVELKPLGQGFVALIKMMIQPVIFCTIVLGVGSVASAARVGKVGGLALGYFLTMSTVALGIGLVVGNLIKPGDGPPARRGRRVGRTGARQRPATAAPRSSCSGSSPTRCSRRSPAVRCSRRSWSPCSSGSRCSRWARRASRSCAASSHAQRLVFRVLSMIMWAAPVGAFGAIAAVVGETGVDALKSLALLMVAFYATCFVFVFVILGALLKAGHRASTCSGCSATWAGSSC